MESVENKELDPGIFRELRDIFKMMEIPQGEWDLFKGMLRGLKMDKGEFLVNEGDVPKRVAFVASGLFRAYYLTESGDEKTIVFRGKGKPLSAYSSFVKEQRAKFSIQALEKSFVVYLTIEDFERLLAGDSIWKILTGQYFMALFIEKEKRERELLSDDAETRYLIFKEEYPGLEERIPHYHIASYLGISPVTLSRIRNKRSD